MWLTQPCALSPHLARSCAVVGAAAALDADDGVDDLPAAVDLLAFVVGDARQRHLVQHRADARTLRCKKGKCMTVKKVSPRLREAARIHLASDPHPSMYMHNAV